MNQLSTGQTDVSRFIGALELGAMPAFDDGALESATNLPLGAGTTTPAGGCKMPPTIVCHHIDDGALEAAQPPMTPHFPPTSVVCRHIDDAALEAAGPSPHTPPTVFLPCRHIDDAALEAAGPNPGGLPPTILPPCRHVDDGALEAAGMGGPLPPTQGPGCIPPTFLCRHVDDGALEAAAGKHAAGPQTHRVAGFPGCM